MSWLSSLFKSKKGDNSNSNSGNQNQTGALMPSVYIMPQYDFTEPRLRETSSFLSDNIARMRKGEFPDYWENALPTMRENMSRPNYEAYYGSAGRQGILRTQADVGSITGLGPKKTTSLVSKSLYDYGNQEKQIDEYLTKLGVDIMQRDATAFPQLSAAMPKGPDAQLAYPQQIQGQTVDAAGGGSAFGSLLNGILGNNGLLGGITNLFGGGGTSGGSSQGSQNILGGLGNMFGGGGTGWSGGSNPTGSLGSYQTLIGNQNAPFSNYGYQQPTSAQSSGSNGFGLYTQPLTYKSVS
jgi:hypothetical protein